MFVWKRQFWDSKKKKKVELQTTHGEDDNQNTDAEFNHGTLCCHGNTIVHLALGNHPDPTTGHSLCERVRINL